MLKARRQAASKQRAADSSSGSHIHMQKLRLVRTFIGFLREGGSRRGRYLGSLREASGALGSIREYEGVLGSIREYSGTLGYLPPLNPPF